MRVIYKLTFDDNSGSVDSEDLEQIAQLRAIKSGNVVALNLEIRITNDPQYRVFEQADVADAVIQELANDMFEKIVTKTPLDPQPEGLNS